MRLIDVDALIEEMRKTEEECENAMTCPSWWSALSVIEKQQTAYNVEKVVEGLEDMKKEESEGCSTIKGKYCSEYIFCGCCIIDRAINIVRRGGVE